MKRASATWTTVARAPEAFTVSTESAAKLVRRRLRSTLRRFRVPASGRREGRQSAGESNESCGDRGARRAGPARRRGQRERHAMDVTQAISRRSQSCRNNSFRSRSTGRSGNRDDLGNLLSCCSRQSLYCSGNSLVKQRTHHHTTIFCLTFLGFVVTDLAALAHGSRSQHVGQRNMPLLDQNVGDIVGAVFA